MNLIILLLLSGMFWTLKQAKARRSKQRFIHGSKCEILKSI